MSGGLKVGSLYVLLSAQTSAFGKGMQDAAKLTEKVANKIKKSAAEIGRVGAMIGAGIGAALAIAASQNKAVASAVNESKAVFNTFANEIATMMLPALHRMNELLREMLGWWQSLSPETKAQIAHWVEVATVVGLAALAIGKVAGLVSALMPAFQAIGAVLALGLSPLLLFVAALVAIGVAVALVHKAWRENWNGIQEKTRGVIEALSGYWQSFKNWLQNSFFDWFIDQWAAIEKAIAHAGNFLKNPLNSDNRDQENRVSDQSIDRWAKSMKAGAMGQALELAVQEIKAGAEVVGNEWKIIADEVSAAFKKILGLNGAQGTVHGMPAVATHVTAAQRLGEAGEQGRMADYYASASVESLSRSKKLGDEGEQGQMTANLAMAYEDEIKTREFWNDQIAKLGNGLKMGATALLSKLGDLGSTINAGVQGFQAGGIWGAIIAVFIELLSKFERFQELIDIGNGQIAQVIEQLKPAFNVIIDALRTFMGASGIMTDVIMRILTPILKIIGKAFQQLAPVIALIATILEPLTLLFDLIGGLFDALSQILGPVFDAIGWIMKIVGETVLGTMNGVMMLWMGILDLLYKFLREIHADGAADEIGKLWQDAKTRVDKIQKQMKDLWDNGYGGLANNAAATSESLGKLGATAEHVGEQLTNIPSGFKTALAQFNATLATSSSSGGGGGASASYTQLQHETERQRFRQTGNATQGNGSARTKRNTET